MCATITVYHDPLIQDTMHFKLTRKCTISPGESVLIFAVANRSVVSASRALTELDTLIDGHQAFEGCLALKVIDQSHNAKSCL